MLPQATGHRPQATGHRPQATGHRPQATGHRPQATACDIAHRAHRGNGLRRVEKPVAVILYGNRLRDCLECCGELSDWRPPLCVRFSLCCNHFRGCCLGRRMRRTACCRCCTRTSGSAPVALKCCAPVLSEYFSVGFRSEHKTELKFSLREDVESRPGADFSNPPRSGPLRSNAVFTCGATNSACP